MTSKEEVKAFKEQGNNAFQAKDFIKAIEYFTKAINLDPDDHVLYSNRSGAYASSDDYFNALKDADKCISLKSDWPKGYSRKGLAEFRLNNLEAAEKAYQDGLKYDPKNPALVIGLKQVQDAKTSNKQQHDMIMSKLIQSNPKYSQYCQEDPQFPDKVKIAIDRMKNFSLIGSPSSAGQDFASTEPRVKEAFLDYLSIMYTGDLPDSNQFNFNENKENKPKEKKPTEVDKRSPNEKDADEFKEKGNKLYKQKNFEEALECYDKALELCPNEILLLSNKAAVYIEMKDYQACLELCQDTINKRYDYKADFSKIAKIYNRMAICYERLGDFESAIKMYQNSLMEDNNRKTRTALKTVERKLETLQKEAYINPELAEEHRSKGNDYFKNSDYPAAIKEYDEAIKRNPKDAKLYSNRAAAYTKLLEYPLALKDCEIALELDPNYVKVWSRKGTLHTFMKDYTQALQAFDQGLAIDPNSAECTYGKQQVVMKIHQSNMSGEVDQDQLQRGLADPEVQKIISDPQFNLILKNISEDPSRVAEYSKDKKIAQGLEKLIAAGILRVA